MHQLAVEFCRSNGRKSKIYFSGKTVMKSETIINGNASPIISHTEI